MSREIGFRVWDKKKKCFLVEWAIYWYDAFKGLRKNLIAEQYTGLKDKNGKEIYEGDIVRCWDDESGEVYFCDTSLQYRVRFTDGDDEDLASCEAEIISNIHETPKGGKK